MLDYPKKVYLNGQILATDNAKVSIFDRGFLFGDGIYEVMVQINGRFFYEKAHLDRLQSCLQKVEITFDVNSLQKVIPDLLTASSLSDTDCLLYIQITRGVAPRQHSFPKKIKPTVLLYAIPKKLPDTNEIHTSVITENDFRWGRCDIKMTSLLGNVMANELAIKNDCFETLLVRDGIITEASHCNVFFVKDDIVFTYPANNFILNGITRQIVFELCQKLNIEIREEGIRLENIKEMSEAFLVGTSTQIAPIKKLDGHIFYADSNIGRVTAKLQLAFLELKRSF